MKLWWNFTLILVNLMFIIIKCTQNLDKEDKYV